MTTTHRGWTISYCSHRRAFEAVAPDYEPLWLGEADGWVDGERFDANTLAEAVAEIDARIAEGAGA
jgi:hypothetical protein